MDQSNPVRDRKEPCRRSDQDSSDPLEAKATVDKAKLLHDLARVCRRSRCDDSSSNFVASHSAGKQMFSDSAARPAAILSELLCFKWLCFQ